MTAVADLILVARSYIFVQCLPPDWVESNLLLMHLLIQVNDKDRRSIHVILWHQSHFIGIVDHKVPLGQFFIVLFSNVAPEITTKGGKVDELILWRYLLFEESLDFVMLQSKQLFQDLEFDVVHFAVQGNCDVRDKSVTQTNLSCLEMELAYPSTNFCLCFQSA